MEDGYREKGKSRLELLINGRNRATGVEGATRVVVKRKMQPG